MRIDGFLNEEGRCGVTLSFRLPAVKREESASVHKNPQPRGFVKHGFRQTERDRQADRQTDRQTDRQVNRQADRHTQTHRQTDRQTDTDTHTGRPTHRHTERRTNTQTHRQTIYSKSNLQLLHAS